MCQEQNFVFFPNMGSEIMYLLLLESSEGIFGRQKLV